MKGKGTATAIFLLRRLSKRAIEMQRNLYLHFIDYKKGFDTVKHQEMLEILARLRMDEEDKKVIRNLY